MTAEIAVLNSQGVALATDSAVTIKTPNGTKIYNSANKLFRLTESSSVGIMVNNAATYMAVPWETIIKAYRKEFGHQKFPTLQDYANDFLDYLDNYIDLPDTGHHSILDELQHYLYMAQGELEKWGEEYFAKHKHKSLPNTIVSKQLLTIIEDLAKLQKQNDLFHGISSRKQFPSLNTKKFRQDIEQIVSMRFHNLSSEMLITELVNICNDIARRGNGLGFNSGIVIAGFGLEEFYPQICSLEICSMVNGTLRHRPLTHDGISPAKNAIIAPFAQKEVVQTFMNGIHPDLADNCPREVEALINEITTLVLDGLHTGSSENRKKLDKLVAQKTKDCLEGLGNRISEWQREMITGPVIRAVAHLPLDELAQMAESLVTMTALRRKISLDPETVGGAVDVAVISKGDGFVWMNRKHYFDPKLNDHFFKR